MTSSRRSFVLIAVLVIVGGALLVTTSLVVLAQAETASLGNAGDQAQSRAVAWSGLQVLMHELDGQRDTILEGDSAELEDSYTIYERGDTLGVIRLLPSGPGGAICQPEAARLDLNVVSAEDLEATTMIDPALAGAIIEARDARPGGRLHSVAELLDVDGVTAEMLWGRPDDMLRDLETSLEDGGIVERNALRFGARPRGLADIVTVHAVEPALQRSGVRRINFNVPWSAELAQRIDERFGEGASTLVKSLIDQGSSFETEAGLYQVYVNFNVNPDDWPDSCDVITAESGPHHFGRLDINSAPLEAIQGLPGVTPDQAALIVDLRAQLDAESRATIAWPAIKRILEPDAYLELADRITARSWTYRVRIAAGEITADDPDAPIANPVIYEAIIDLADPAPRLAYLRDLSMQSTALGLAMASTDSGLAERRAFERDRAFDRPEQPSDELEATIPDFGFDELDFGGADEASSPGMSMDDAPPVDGSDQQAPPNAGFDDANDDPGSMPVQPAQPPQTNQPAQPAGLRVGRWTTGT
jgi:DNA uptake protein ComE-like DNA-binding protein